MFQKRLRTLKYFNDRKSPRERLPLILGTAGILGYAFYATHLETAPITNRSRFILVSPQTESQLGTSTYKEIMSEYRQAMIPNYYPIVKKVQNVASRLINVSGLDHLDWQVHVIQSPIKNAFVIPGGKIFVFTGILEVADTPDKLAAVLGHEIAHVVARHSAEQLSFRAVVIMANTLVSIFMDPPRLLKNLLFQYGFLMPHSRVCETEADEIGLHLMSRACYDPRGAVEFWRSMDKQDKEILQFLSTHPKSETRIENLKKLIPKGDVIRHDSGCDLASSMFHQYQSFFK